MLLGYNTNGFAHHDPYQAIELLAEIGYRSVALTLDHGLLNPFSADLATEERRMRQALERAGMRSVIETGARFLLDPRRKHEPTLVSTDPVDRQRRVEFLCRAIDVATSLGSDCVSFWAGTVPDGVSTDVAFERLVSGLRQVVDHATARGVTLGFEPEPGMLIDTMSSYDALLQRIDAPVFQLTLDVGHLHCLGETPIAGYIQRYAQRIVNVHIEDMRVGVHEHLQFGDGEMQFEPILSAFEQIGYRGGVHVELSRHSHAAPTAAQQAYDFLKSLAKYE